VSNHPARDASLFPRPEPQPVPGCQECLDLARRRCAARQVHDLSGVTDCNVLLRRHRDQAHS
jgi:hypothetical protein